jgi:glycosyltransferase involved in cell wall biosynthesis
MPKLAIIDQSVSAGGVERFLFGLVNELIQLPEIKDWEITILINHINTAGHSVIWPNDISSHKIQIKYLFDDRLSHLLKHISKPKRIWGIYGTSYLQLLIARLMMKIGTPIIRGALGNAKLYIEHFCNSKKFDIVYFAYPYFMDVPSINSPVVTTPHDFNWKHCELGTLGPEATEILEKETPFWLSASNNIVVSSEFIARELQQYYPESANKTQVIRPGIPTSKNHPTAEQIDETLTSFNIKKPFLLSAGWVGPHKNQKIIFEALGHLKAKGIQVKVVFAGMNSNVLIPGEMIKGNKYLDEIMDVIATFNLKYGDDYVVLGFVNDFQLDCLYRNATITIQPSLYEAGSFTIIEASHAKCPVACSRIPAHIEQSLLLEGNITMFDPYNGQDVANTIEMMLSNQEMIMTMAEKAASIVEEKYSWENMARQYFNIFSNIFKLQNQTPIKNI